jgi:DNA end-binding protein Ku
LRKRTDTNNDDREATARPFWSGTISFGLVSIPVNLFPGNRDSRVALRMIGPDGEPLKREYVAAETGSELDASQMTRGFENDKGNYITVSEEELERLAPDKSRDIDLRLFVAREEISPMYFDRAYFLTPADASAKAYRLLAETMQRRDRVGIATFVMRGKEYLVAIYAENGILRAETMRFSDEIRTPREIGLPNKTKVSAAAVRKFATVIAKDEKKTIDTKEMRDEYAEAMLKLIENKSSRHKDIVESEHERRPEKVIDLMEVLKKSLEGNGSGGKAPLPSRTRTRKRTSRRTA